MTACLPTCGTCWAYDSGFCHYEPPAMLNREGTMSGYVPVGRDKVGCTKHPDWPDPVEWRRRENERIYEDVVVIADPPRASPAPPCSFRVVQEAPRWWHLSRWFPWWPM